MNQLRTCSLLITVCAYIIFGHQVFSQIPSNVRGAPCVNPMITEDFSDVVPDGWEGDWMTLAPPLVEGWNLISGPTPDAPLTGANGAFSGSFYAYMETSGPAGMNSIFAINTPAIPLFDVNTSIRFRVLMHGAAIGSLKVNVLSGPGFTNSDNVLTLTGAQHSSSDVSNWEEAFIDISQYDGQSIKVEFEGMKLLTGQGDIAIDLIEICSEPRIPTLGEWGIIVLLQLLLIFGVVAMRNRSLVPVKL